MSAEQVTSFRRWLIDRLKETRYRIFSGETMDELALRLGVQPDIVRTAQAEKAREMHMLGRERSRRNNFWPGTQTRKLPIWCPELVYDVLKRRAEAMRLTPVELTRAILQALLSGPDNPWWLINGWMFQGKRMRMKRPNGEPWRWVINLTMSLGAYVALARRAERLGVSKTALVRGAIVDYLENRLVHIQILPVSAMWQDANRYWTGELTRKGQYDGHSRTLEP
jgi:hypothetical protein